jgi:hypothetical protein
VSAALAKDPQLKDFSGVVQDSGEGRRTIEAAMEEAVLADVLSSSLYARFRSRLEHPFGERTRLAMRFGFGGHIEGNEPIGAELKPAETQWRHDRQPTNLDISDCAGRCGAAAAAAQAGRSLRHGDLRCRR